MPVMPLPITTTSAVPGKLRVVRWPSSNGEGSVCQNDFVDSGLGREHGCLWAGMSGFEMGIVMLLLEALFCGERNRK